MGFTTKGAILAFLGVIAVVALIAIPVAVKNKDNRSEFSAVEAGDPPIGGNDRGIGGDGGQQTPPDPVPTPVPSVAIVLNSDMPSMVPSPAPVFEDGTRDIPDYTLTAVPSDLPSYFPTSVPAAPVPITAAPIEAPVATAAPMYSTTTGFFPVNEPAVPVPVADAGAPSMMPSDFPSMIPLYSIPSDRKDRALEEDENEVSPKKFRALRKVEK